MNFINTEIIQALGYTIFHSIWQVTLYAFLMSFILSLVKTEKANLRYLIAIGTLFGSFFTSVFTFGYYYTTAINVGHTFRNIRIPESYEQVVILSNDNSWLQNLNIFLEANIPWISFVWGIGIVFFLIKIILGLHYTGGIKSSSRTINKEVFLSILENLKGKAFLNRPIELRESLKINSPSVIGIIKPIIYFPIGLINELNIQDTEAIIAHELGHIIRHDFLVNIIQSFIEAFYYFHPAAWWISVNIRTEREHACDDLAIKIIGDKLKYAKSLMLLQEWEMLSNKGLAMNFSNSETPLFSRLKRILNQHKNKHEMKQKIFASIILLTSIFWISTINSQNNIEQNQEEITTLVESEIKDEIAFVFPSINDTIPANVKKSKSTIVELQNGKIQRLEIDGEEIKEEDFHQHEELVENLRHQKIPQMKSNNYFFAPGTEDFNFKIFENDMNNLSEDLAFNIEQWSESSKEFFENHAMELENWNENLLEQLEDQKIELENLFEENEFPFEGDFDFHFNDTIKRDFDSLRIQFGKHELNFPEMAEDVKIFIDSLRIPEMAEDVFIYLDSINFRDIGRDIRIALDSISFPKFENDFRIYSGGNLESRFIEELKTDGLYKNGDNEIKLNSEELIINNEVQTFEKLDKYIRIYEESTGTKFQDGSSLNIVIEDKKKKDFKRI